MPKPSPRIDPPPLPPSDAERDDVRARVVGALTLSVDHHGPAVLFERSAIDDALRDARVENTREADLVRIALDDEVPQQLLASHGRGEWPPSPEGFVGAWADHRSIDAGSAAWVVDAWSAALSLRLVEDAEASAAPDLLFAPTVPMEFGEERSIAQPWAVGRSAPRRSAAPLITSLGTEERVVSPSTPPAATDARASSPEATDVEAPRMPARRREDRHEPLIAQVGRAAERVGHRDQHEAARPPPAQDEVADAADAATPAEARTAPQAREHEPFVAKRAATTVPPRRTGRVVVGIVVGLVFAGAFYILNTRPDLIDAIGDHPQRISPTLPGDRTRSGANADALKSDAPIAQPRAPADVSTTTGPPTVASTSAPADAAPPPTLSPETRTPTQEQPSTTSIERAPAAPSKPVDERDAGETATASSSEPPPTSQAPAPTEPAAGPAHVPAPTPPRIVRIDVPRIVAGRSFQVALRVDADASRIASLERRIVGSDVTWPSTVTTIPSAELVRTKDGALLASFAPIARPSSTTAQFTVVDRDGRRSAPKNVTLRAVEDAYMSTATSSAAPSAASSRAVDYCAQAECGTVASATRSDVPGVWDVEIRMDDRATHTVRQTTPWPTGTRVQRRGSTFVSIDR